MCPLDKFVPVLFLLHLWHTLAHMARYDQSMALTDGTADSGSCKSTANSRFTSDHQLYSPSRLDTSPTGKAVYKSEGTRKREEGEESSE